MKLLPDNYILHVINTLMGMVEKQRRLYLGSLAIALGYGGISALSRATGVSRGCIQRGVYEVKSGEVYAHGDRSRAAGGGRKPITEKHRESILKMGRFSDEELPEVIDVMKVVDKIVENSSYGDPMHNNAWINATTRSIADAVFEKTGLRYSHTSIKNILRRLNYSLQKNQKYDQVGKAHPMRDTQFCHISAKKHEYISNGDPVISIDTKAKEKLGDFIRPGKEYRRTKDPKRVLDHDFAFLYREIYPKGNNNLSEAMLKKKAVVIPYGIYCLNNNTGYTVIGVDHDTSEFAADSIALWWKHQGRAQFPNAKRILILADGGGSNRSRGCIWKAALQQLSDTLDLQIEMCHYPPGTSKFNPIERRMWSQVSHSWTAKPLKNLEIIQGYTSHTSTKTGLSVVCAINYKSYMTESDKKKAIAEGKNYTGIINDEAHQKDILIQNIGDSDAMKKWNYLITPHSPERRWKDYRMVA